MKFTGERYLPEVNGLVATQHYSRYIYAINAINLEGNVVLDIASGEGYGTELLSRYSKQVYGIDISSEAIETAKSKYKSSNIEFKLGSASAIPLPDNCIDVAVSFETIEHHTEHELMLREIKRVLKKNGVLIISSPNKSFYQKHFPNFKNEFHQKELSESEFGDFMHSHFKYCNFYMQNDFLGTFIVPSLKNDNYSIPLLCDRTSLTCETIEARYNICIASDFEIKCNNSTLFFSDNDFFTRLFLSQARLNRIISPKIWEIYSSFKKLIKR
jgi:ubiquinone/menaquinone biosynthesis C-methylase UbiE